LHVRRIKHGTPATHPLTGREMRALRKHQRESRRSAFVFVSERGAPLSAPGFSRMVERAGRAAKLGIKVHAHMLRHACGLRLSKCWARHSCAAGVLGPSQYPEHDAIHGASTGSI
jgi:type 1 fimbriae regulatory protein FimB/type 1 fimbriae regulatory protein FimE